MKQWNELKDYVIKQMIAGTKKDMDTFKKILKEMDELEQKYRKLQNPYIDYDPDVNHASY